MVNVFYVIVVAFSIYHVSNGRQLTRECRESKGRCGINRNVNCNEMFGPGWVEKGKCCRKRPCCVFSFQCEDIQQIPNGKVTKTGTSIGSTATFICDTGYNLRPRRKSITCTGDGWSDYIPICFDIRKTTVQFKGSTYIFDYRGVNWFGAEVYCKGQGGHLVTIETEEENKYLQYVLQTIFDAPWWIGLSDVETEGSFQWTSNQQLTFTDWYQGHPLQPDTKTGADSDCVLAHFQNSFQWSEQSCTDYNSPLCEI
ncbi:macrophage mannose receptor 1-like [Mytilus galloprovincialis]|uniref:macrophage mannose receptor 1-like n=1 Tax=Mytilus galloprovincialis TaxID=29158 RepID=UPI003F7C6C94